MTNDNLTEFSFELKLSTRVDKKCEEVEEVCLEIYL